MRKIQVYIVIFALLIISTASGEKVHYAASASASMSAAASGFNCQMCTDPMQISSCNDCINRAATSLLGGNPDANAACASVFTEAKYGFFGSRNLGILCSIQLTVDQGKNKNCYDSFKDSIDKVIKTDEGYPCGTELNPNYDGNKFCADQGYIIREGAKCQPFFPKVCMKALGGIFTCQKKETNMINCDSCGSHDPGNLGLGKDCAIDGQAGKCAKLGLLVDKPTIDKAPQEYCKEALHNSKGFGGCGPDFVCCKEMYQAIDESSNYISDCANTASPNSGEYCEMLGGLKLKTIQDVFNVIYTDKAYSSKAQGEITKAMAVCLFSPDERAAYQKLGQPDFPNKGEKGSERRSQGITKSCCERTDENGLNGVWKKDDKICGVAPVKPTQVPTAQPTQQPPPPPEQKPEGGPGSCPYLYTGDHLQEDIVVLKFSKWMDEPYYTKLDGFNDSITVKEHLIETSYIDSLALLEVKNAGSMQVYLDQLGSPVGLRSPVSLKCTSKDGEDCTSQISHRDADFITPFDGFKARVIAPADYGKNAYSSPKADDTSDYLELTLPDAKAGKATIIMGYSETPEMAAFEPKLVQRFGGSLRLMFSLADAKPVSDAFEKNMQDFGMGKIQMQDKNGNWETYPGSEFITLNEKTQAFTIDMCRLKSNKIRIEFIRGEFAFDYIGVDLDSERDLTAQAVLPTRAFDNKGKDMLSTLSASDKDYVVLNTGDFVTVTFPESVPGSQYFVVSKGYYVPGNKEDKMTVDPVQMIDLIKLAGDKETARKFVRELIN